MKFTFTVTKKAIDESYERVVKKAVAQTNIKGFRKGQAPKELVIKEIGESKLQQQAIEEALPQAYIKAVKAQKLEPISYPDIKLKKGVVGEDFEFEAEIAQKPEVKLGDYKKDLANLLASKKIWTPDQGDDKKTSGPSHEEKIDLVLQKLLETVKLEVPELLVKRETSRMLARLIEQIDKLGLNIDDYLASTKQTKETLNQTYKTNAQNQLALEFILMEIAQDLKTEASPSEVDKFISAIGDPKTQEQLQNPEQRANIHVMLTKQAVIAELLKLAEGN